MFVLVPEERLRRQFVGIDRLNIDVASAWNRLMIVLLWVYFFFFFLIVTSRPSPAVVVRRPSATFPAVFDTRLIMCSH